MAEISNLGNAGQTFWRPTSVNEILVLADILATITTSRYKVNLQFTADDPTDTSYLFLMSMNVSQNLAAPTVNMGLMRFTQSTAIMTIEKEEARGIRFVALKTGIQIAITIN
jgi:hypothetical protein